MYINRVKKSKYCVEKGSKRAEGQIYILLT